MRTPGRTIAVGAGATAVGLVAAFLLGPAPRVPSFAEVRAAYRPSDVALVDRHGEVLHERRVDPIRRRLAWTPLAEVSPALRTAVLASEDRRFDRHGGVDARALAAAAWGRLTRGPPRGASTIPMQLAALIDPDLRRRGGPRTFAQKWRQMRLAWALGGRWTRAEILEAYLNLVTFRGELTGVRAASAALLGKAPHGLTGAEAAVLAALLRGPNAEAGVVARRATALVAGQDGTVPADMVQDAARRALKAPSGAASRAAWAPHVAARLLALTPGAAAGGGPLRSTLDASLQRFASDALVRHLLGVRDRHVRDGAVLVADVETGDVLAYVGGGGELASARHVDGVRARRQAGSTLKPLLYGLALEARLLTAATLLEDAPLEVPTPNGLYRPRDYDDEWRGLVSVRTALAASLNAPAVRTLELVGADLLLDRLRRLGFSGLDEPGDFYGPALALGSADVSLWELVQAYRVLARGGAAGPLRLAPGEPMAPPDRAYAEPAAFVVADILAHRESRSATFGLENVLATRYWTAVKTGTSKEMRDNWCVGFSRRYVVGVWVGNFSGAPMRDVSGITGAAPVWREVMDELHRTAPSHPPGVPAGLVGSPVRFARAGEPERIEWFLAGTEPPPAPAWSSPGARPGRPRILAPARSAVVALDPDIPPARQRIVFEGDPAGAAVRWMLDGEDLGPAAELVVWTPRPGRHTLSLVDRAARVVDAVTFEVRGEPEASR